MAYRPDATADYVGLQRITGTLAASPARSCSARPGRSTVRRPPARGPSSRARAPTSWPASPARGPSAPRVVASPLSASTTTSDGRRRPEFDRAANLLGALSLAMADRMAGVMQGTVAASATAATALSALGDFLDGASIDLLSQVLGLTSSGTVRLVDRLSAAGYVRRAPGADARTTSIVLTEAGRRVAADVAGRPRRPLVGCARRPDRRRAAASSKASRVGRWPDWCADPAPPGGSAASATRRPVAEPKGSARWQTRQRRPTYRVRVNATAASRAGVPWSRCGDGHRRPMRHRSSVRPL